MNEYIEWNVASWNEAVEVAKHMNGWVFRGQESIDWELTSSLERISRIYNYPIIDLHGLEHRIGSLFKRQAHHYLPKPPADGEDLEWLSIMQHHGAPTRLVDVSESFYVAAFFALENALNTSVVWAFDRFHINKQVSTWAPGCRPFGAEFEDLVRTDASNKLWEQSGPSKVLVVRPSRLNQRLILQQGAFLCPLGADISFEHCLCKSFGIPGSSLPVKTVVLDKNSIIEELQPPNSSLKLVKFIIPARERLTALRDLNRMNITAATLFPGLDGFARSLKFEAKIMSDLN